VRPARHGHSPGWPLKTARPGRSGEAPLAGERTGDAGVGTPALAAWASSRWQRQGAPVLLTHGTGVRGSDLTPGSSATGVWCRPSDHSGEPGTPAPCRLPGFFFFRLRPRRPRGKYGVAGRLMVGADDEDVLLWMR